MGSANDRFTLRDLALPSRVVLSFFLISVGIAYISALVQLHFNGGARAGEPLPGPDDAAAHYSGLGMSQLERLLIADETRAFNGNGTMRPAFTGRSAGWRPAIMKWAKEKNVSEEQAEKDLRKLRVVEIDAALHWLRNGAKEEDYEAHPIPEGLAKRAAGYPVANFFKEGDDGKIVSANVKQIITTRCVKCHYDGARGAEGEIHLEEFDVVRHYATAPAPDTPGGGMSLHKLAQSTHVHLLGFSMLYGLTGLILTFTSYPLWLRLIVGPWALAAQLVDISFWWLARTDPMFGKLIPVTGGLAALGLVTQIGLSLFNMYGKKGKFVLLLLIVAAAAGAGALKHTVVDPWLDKEKAHSSQVD